MTNKEKLQEYFKQDFYTQTRFTGNFINSFALQLQYLDKEITNEVIHEWQGVVGDILEIMRPYLTHDIKFFTDLDGLLKSLITEG